MSTVGAERRKHMPDGSEGQQQPTAEQIAADKILAEGGTFRSATKHGDANDIDREAAEAETRARLNPKTKEQLDDEASDKARADKIKNKILAEGGTFRSATKHGDANDIDREAAEAETRARTNPLTEREQAEKQKQEAADAVRAKKAKAEAAKTTAPAPAAPAPVVPETPASKADEGIQAEKKTPAKKGEAQAPQEQFADQSGGAYKVVGEKQVTVDANGYVAEKWTERNDNGLEKQVSKGYPGENPASGEAPQAETPRTPPAGGETQKNVADMTQEELANEMGLLLDKLAEKNNDPKLTEEAKHKVWLEASGRAKEKKPAEEIGHLIPTIINQRREVFELRQMLKEKQEAAKTSAKPPTATAESKNPANQLPEGQGEDAAGPEAGEGLDEAQRKIAEMLAKNPNPSDAPANPEPTASSGEPRVYSSSSYPLESKVDISEEPKVVQGEIPPTSPIILTSPDQAFSPAEPITAPEPATPPVGDRESVSDEAAKLLEEIKITPQINGASESAVAPVSKDKISWFSKIFRRGKKPAPTVTATPTEASTNATAADEANPTGTSNNLEATAGTADQAGQSAVATPETPSEQTPTDKERGPSLADRQISLGQELESAFGVSEKSPEQRAKLAELDDRLVELMKQGATFPRELREKLRDARVGQVTDMPQPAGVIPPTVLEATAPVKQPAAEIGGQLAKEVPVAEVPLDQRVAEALEKAKIVRSDAMQEELRVLDNEVEVDETLTPEQKKALQEQVKSARWGQVSWPPSPKKPFEALNIAVSAADQAKQPAATTETHEAVSPAILVREKLESEVSVGGPVRILSVIAEDSRGQDVNIEIGGEKSELVWRQDKINGELRKGYVSLMSESLEKATGSLKIPEGTRADIVVGGRSDLAGTLFVTGGKGIEIPIEKLRDISRAQTLTVSLMDKNYEGWEQESKNYRDPGRATFQSHTNSEQHDADWPVGTAIDFLKNDAENPPASDEELLAAIADQTEQLTREQPLTVETTPPAEQVKPFADRAREVLESTAVGKEAEAARKQTLQDLDNELQRIKKEQGGKLTPEQEEFQQKILDQRWGRKSSEQPAAPAVAKASAPISLNSDFWKAQASFQPTPAEKLEAAVAAPEPADNTPEGRIKAAEKVAREASAASEKANSDYARGLNLDGNEEYVAAESNSKKAWDDYDKARKSSGLSSSAFDTTPAGSKLAEKMHATYSVASNLYSKIENAFNATPAGKELKEKLDALYGVRIEARDALNQARKVNSVASSPAAAPATTESRNPTPAATETLNAEAKTEESEVKLEVEPIPGRETDRVRSVKLKINGNETTFLWDQPKDERGNLKKGEFLLNVPSEIKENLQIPQGTRLKTFGMNPIYITGGKDVTLSSEDLKELFRVSPQIELETKDSEQWVNDSDLFSKEDGKVTYIPVGSTIVRDLSIKEAVDILKTAEATAPVKQPAAAEIGGQSAKEVPVAEVPLDQRVAEALEKAKIVRSDAMQEELRVLDNEVEVDETLTPEQKKALQEQVKSARWGQVSWPPSPKKPFEALNIAVSAADQAKQPAATTETHEAVSPAILVREKLESEVSVGGPVRILSVIAEDSRGQDVNIEIGGEKSELVWRQDKINGELRKGYVSLKSESLEKTTGSLRIPEGTRVDIVVGGESGFAGTLFVTGGEGVEIPIEKLRDISRAQTLTVSLMDKNYEGWEQESGNYGNPGSAKFQAHDSSESLLYSSVGEAVGSLKMYAEEDLSGFAEETPKQPVEEKAPNTEITPPAESIKPLYQRVTEALERARVIRDDRSKGELEAIDNEIQIKKGKGESVPEGLEKKVMEARESQAKERLLRVKEDVVGKEEENLIRLTLNEKDSGTWRKENEGVYELENFADSLQNSLDLPEGTDLFMTAPNVGYSHISGARDIKLSASDLKELIDHGVGIALYVKGNHYDDGSPSSVEKGKASWTEAGFLSEEKRNIPVEEAVALFKKSLGINSPVATPSAQTPASTPTPTVRSGPDFLADDSDLPTPTPAAPATPEVSPMAAKPETELEKRIGEFSDRVSTALIVSEATARGNTLQDIVNERTDYRKFQDAELALQNQAVLELVGREMAGETTQKQVLEDLDNELQRIKKEQGGKLTPEQEEFQQKILDQRWGRKPSGGL